jgi:hypothetical protein
MERKHWLEVGRRLVEARLQSEPEEVILDVDATGIEAEKPYLPTKRTGEAVWAGMGKNRREDIWGPGSGTKVSSEPPLTTHGWPPWAFSQGHSTLHNRASWNTNMLRTKNVALCYNCLHR